MGCFRQSKSRTALFLSMILRQPCSTGWVVKLQNQATAALRPAYEGLATQLPTEPVLSLDETPTKEGTAKNWLWTYVAKKFTLFAVRPSRAASGITDLLGESFPGVVHCDRARMYLTLTRLQWCWAHLKRDFQGLVDQGDGQAKRLGHDLLRPTRELFKHWANYRDGTISRAALQRRMAPVRRAVERLLVRGINSGNRSLVGICRELYEHRAWLWSFVRQEDVEPTNNASERALRHAVIWRKLLVRHTKRRWQPLRRDHAHDHRDLPTTTSQRLRIRQRHHRSSPRRQTTPLVTPQGVNGYRFAYQPYGQSQELNPDYSNYSGADYEWENRFTGRELDLESGLQINRNRYLHQQLGRWLTRDPIGYNGSKWNLYEYIGGTPTSGFDPSGEFEPIEICIIIGIGIGLACGGCHKNPPPPPPPPPTAKEAMWAPTPR